MLTAAADLSVGPRYFWIGRRCSQFELRTHPTQSREMGHPKWLHVAHRKTERVRARHNGRPPGGTGGHIERNDPARPAPGFGPRELRVLTRDPTECKTIPRNCPHVPARARRESRFGIPQNATIPGNQILAFRRANRESRLGIPPNVMIPRNRLQTSARANRES